MAFSCHVTLSSLNLGQLPSPSLSFVICALLKDTHWLFSRRSHDLGLSDVFSKLSVVRFW